jgi:NitT/TauT family transport system substrate-binding protein
MAARVSAARGALFCSALWSLAWMPLPALADDTLNVIGNSSPLSYFAVTDDVALYAGFFKEEHLNVNIIYKNRPGAYGTALIGTQAAANGEGDVATTTLEPVLQGYDKGLRLQAFFARDPQYEFVLAVLADSPIKTLADFKGKTIGEPQPHSTAEIVTAALAGAGLGRGDFTYVPIGQGDPAIAAIAAKKVDGYAFPYVELASYEVRAHYTFRYLWDPITEDISDASYSASPAVIATKPDLLRRYARAIVQAAIAVRENPELAARCYLYGAGIAVTDQSLHDEIALLNLIQGQLPGVDPLSKKIGYIPPRSVTAYVKYLVANGQMRAPIPTSVLVTDQFIDYANDFDHKAFIARVKRMRFEPPAQ